MNLLAAECCKFLEQLFLLRGEMCGGFNIDPNQLVSLQASPGILYTFSFHAKDFARLGSRGNLHLDFPFKRRNLNLGAKSGLNEADRHVTNDILTFPNE